jgi:hypothetical protein
VYLSSQAVAAAANVGGILLPAVAGLGKWKVSGRPGHGRRRAVERAVLFGKEATTAL